MMKLGILGPEGTFTEAAAKKWRPDAEKIFFDDITGAVEAVIKGDIDEAIVPVENSLEGSVGAALDALMEYPARIVGEVVVPIQHCLLALTPNAEIKVVLSHPQALAQCRGYLRKNFPGVEVRTTGSTAHAAKLAKEFPEMAAIASRDAADRYGLSVVDEDIQDREENYTRFIVVAREDGPVVGDKTSIGVYLKKNRPGALYDLLGDFAKYEINLTKIESRPSKKALGDYVFYIDFEGSIDDPRVDEALRNVREKTEWLKVFGSYPRAS